MMNTSQGSIMHKFYCNNSIPPDRFNPQVRPLLGCPGRDLLGVGLTIVSDLWCFN